MTTDQYWQQLDTLAASKGTDRLLEAAELLRDHPELPLLISCRRVHGRIRHLFTSFDERSPDAAGNRYYLMDKGYRDYFKRVVFAIKGGGRNYEVFRDILMEEQP